MKLFKRTKHIYYAINGKGIKTMQDVIDLLAAFRFGVTLAEPDQQMEELVKRELVTKSEV